MIFPALRAAHGFGTGDVRMLKQIAMAAAAAAGFCGAALAQPAPSYNWTGYYLGGSIAATYGTVDWEYWNLPGQTLTRHPAGVMFGAHGGYRMRQNDMVYGIELSWLSGLKVENTGPDAPIFAPAFDSYARINSLVTVGPRLGWIVNERWQPYITGGFAGGEVLTSFFAKGFSPGFGNTVSGWHWGWFAGTGVDYAWTKSTTIGLEYLHVDLNSELRSSTIVPAAGAARYIEPSADILRVKLTFAIP